MERDQIKSLSKKHNVSEQCVYQVKEGPEERRASTFKALLPPLVNTC